MSCPTARKWNFLSFHGPTHSAILMEFTAPVAYAETVVAVGAVVTDGKIIFAGASPNTSVAHTKTLTDKTNKLEEPVEATYTIGSPTGTERAIVTGPIAPRLDLIDIMGELPAIVKSIASSASGTRPYIYQYGPSVTLNLEGENAQQEQGRAFIEATFIS